MASQKPTFSLFVSIAACILSYFIEPYIGYQSVGLILMLPILMASFSGEIKVVILTGTLSALAWNFFFIPPKFHFSISRTEDKIMILTYFIVSIIMAVLASRIHKNKLVIESERLYRALFDSVSHELKTPLTAIMGSASAIISTEVSKESLKILLEEISTASLRLENVINNLLDMSRIKSGALIPKKEVIEMSSFFEEFLARHQDLLKNIKVLVKKNPDELFVIGDEGLLENVFLNIFRNCIRHGGKVTEIEINSSVIGSQISIDINDNGSGVPDEKLNLLFESFFSTNKANGLGLGLSISRAFIESQGGTISAKNLKLPGGFSITIKLPLFNLSESNYKNANQ